MARRIATGLLIASLILLIVYGADVAVAAASPDGEGFLPFDEAVRGGAFGGGSVVMSIIAFVIARKEYAPIVSALLFVNGRLGRYIFFADLEGEQSEAAVGDAIGAVRSKVETLRVLGSYPAA